MLFRVGNGRGHFPSFPPCAARVRRSHARKCSAGGIRARDLGFCYVERVASRIHDDVWPISSSGAARWAHRKRDSHSGSSIPLGETGGRQVTDPLIISAGGFLILGLAVGSLCYLAILRRTLQVQRAAILAKDPGSLIIPCTAAIVTSRSLRRIQQANGHIYGRTGQVYSLVASPGQLRLFRGRAVEVIASFRPGELRDVRVGSTSFGLADYTTMFFGVDAGQTTFELPVRVNGPRATSMFSSSRAWAEDRAEAVLRTLRQLPEARES